MSEHQSDDDIEKVPGEPEAVTESPVAAEAVPKAPKASPPPAAREDAVTEAPSASEALPDAPVVPDEAPANAADGAAMESAGEQPEEITSPPADGIASGAPEPEAVTEPASSAPRPAPDSAPSPQDRDENDLVPDVTTGTVTESPGASESIAEKPAGSEGDRLDASGTSDSVASAPIGDAGNPAGVSAEPPPTAETPRRTRRTRRTEPAHAEPQTDAPDVEAAAAAALDAAEGGESEADSVTPRAEGEGADGEAPAVGEGHEPPERLKSIIESLIFAADKPLSVRKLQELTGEKNAQWIQSCIEFLRADYGDRGVVLHEVAGGFQFRTNPLNAHWVQQLIAGKPVRLSRAQLETLAICAYRQPITRPEIDEIRGVDSGGTLKVLLDRSLVRILGKKEEPGRPMLYGTTKDFLEFFNLKDLKELPTLREFYELNEDSMAKIRELDERRAAEGVPPAGQPAPEPAEVVADEAAPPAATGAGGEAESPAQ